MIRWIEEPELNRVVGRCGGVSIGAVFLRARGGRRVRWRAFITKNINAVDGNSPTMDEAKQQIVTRFAEFLTLAKLQPIPGST